MMGHSWDPGHVHAFAREFAANYRGGAWALLVPEVRNALLTDYIVNRVISPVSTVTLLEVWALRQDVARQLSALEMPL